MPRCRSASESFPSACATTILSDGTAKERTFPSKCPPPVDPRVARANTIAERFENGDIEGALEFFVDEVNGRGSWKSRSEEERQFARDSAWTLTRQIVDVDIVACDDLGALKMPVLLMGGEKAVGVLTDILNEAQKCLPSAQRVTIPNAAHRMNRDNPAAFNRALVEFFTAMSRRSRSRP